MSKNVCFIDWKMFSLQGPRVYIYTLLQELQPDTTKIRIPDLDRIRVQNDLNN